MKIPPELRTRIDVVFMKNIIKLEFMCKKKKLMKDFITFKMILQEPSFIDEMCNPSY